MFKNLTKLWNIFDLLVQVYFAESQRAWFWSEIWRVSSGDFLFMIVNVIWSVQVNPCSSLLMWFDQEEANNLVDHLLSSSKANKAEDTLVKEQFSIPVVNVIWRMVASKTFTIGSEEGWRYKTFLVFHIPLCRQSCWTGSKFIALMEELFTQTLSVLALFPLVGKYLAKKKIQRR